MTNHLIKGKVCLKFGQMGNRISQYFIWVFYAVFHFNMGAQPTVPAVKIDNLPKIDGVLNDAAWTEANVISDLVQRVPNTGDPISEKTEVLICYGEKYIYVGVRCFDDPTKITAKELKRDISLRYDDRVQIIFDSFLDRRNGFWFQIGPRGCIGDGLVSEDGAVFNKQWDGLWEGKAKIHKHGWDAEMAVPFKTLNFRPEQDTWGLKIIRHIRRKLESAYWPETSLNAYNFGVSDGGNLTGLEGMSQGIGLDIRPYLLTGFDQKPGQKNDYKLDVGGDIFYQISSGLNAALTINTDFAQTEVDSRQINLTRFALFFPEKRNFFLDGAHYFNFGFNADSDNPHKNALIPYFSRRIGLSDEGSPIPIVVGGKIAGQIGKWNIGALNILDRQNDQNRNSAVVRVGRNLGKQSYVGVIGTRGDMAGSAHWLGGVDLKLSTATFQKDKRLVFSSYLLKSKVEELSGQDNSFGIDLNYPNDLIKFRVGFQSIGTNFRADIGFVPRTGIRGTYGSFYLGPRPNKWGLLKVNSGGQIDYITDFNNKLLTRDFFLKLVELEFKSGEVAELALANTFEFLDTPFDIYKKDSISIAAGSYSFWRPSIELTTARRRNAWVALELEWGDFFDGEQTAITLFGGVKIGVPLFIGGEYEQNNVKLKEGDFTARVYRFTADVNVNPDISLSNFLQYDNVTENLGVQSRLRWIIKAGNEIIMVWNSLQPYAFNERFKMNSDNSVRFKLNYNFRF